MKHMQQLTAAAAVLALGAATAALHAEPFLYVSANFGSRLVKVDVGAGTVTDIGPFNQPGCFAIAVNPLGGLYTVTQGFPPGSPQPRLARVDAATGNVTPFGVNLNPEIFMGLGFAPDGTLYGVNAGSGTPDAGSLYKFDLVTGAAIKVGVTGGCFDIMDLAWAPDGTMYGAVNDSLYRVEATTGQATLVTKLQGVSRVMGLAIDQLGNFYVSEIVTNAPLYRVNPATGATVKLFDTGVDYLHGLAIRPPSPGGPIIYASGESGTQLVRIDVGASNVTVVGPARVRGALAVAIRPDGLIYTAVDSATSDSGTPKLATFDLATGKATVFGPAMPKLMGLTCLPDGRLFGVNARFDRSFYVVDPVTSKATRVGAAGAGGDIMDLAWHPDGTLYAIEPTALYRVDPVAGKRTLVKSLKGLSNPMGLTIDHDGTTYAADHVAQSPIKRIDPATGQTTLVVQTRVNHIHGICIAPAPAARVTRADDRLEIAWPAWAAGHVLQSAPSLGGDAAWTPVPSVPVTEGDRVSAAWDLSGPARYFRLVKR
jgi:DNA-binding beta-propeller fold protein YncE